MNPATRERMSLDGHWQFWPDLHSKLAPRGLLGGTADEDTSPTEAELTSALGSPRAIAVPGAWQAQFEDLRSWAGRAYYERTFKVLGAWAGRRVRLCFGAVDYHCAVWLNGALLGRHEGGYLPFELDASDAIRHGAPNSVIVEVIDAGPGDNDPFSFDEIPHGKQSWYGPVGGLWQGVKLEASSPIFVHKALVHADPQACIAAVRARLGAPAAGGEQLVYTITSPGGHSVSSVHGAPLDAGATHEEIAIPLASPELWDPASPNLYSLAVSLLHEGRAADEWSDGFGFRSIAADDGALLLNGRPLYVLGALDQDYYHPTGYTPPSDDLLRTQVLRAKELGLNLLRCHIKVPDPRYMYWADRLGILVWAELPNWNTLTEDSKRRGRDTLAGLIERDFNHPSVVIWTIINESWGIDLAGDASQRRWLAETFDWAKPLDPTRLLVDNSACPPSFHLKSDLNDFHFYKAIPDHADEWADLTEVFAARPERFYSPHGDAERTGREPQLVSEFGNWGLPDINNLLDNDGRDPWWFATGGERAGGIVEPRGVKDRFTEWGLDAVFGSWRELVRHSQEHQFEAMRFEIEDMRRHPEITGYVITEFTDVNWECNGLLDMARNPKSYHHRFNQVNAPDVVFAVPGRRRYSTGDAVGLDVFASHYSALDLGGCKVTWHAAGLDVGGELTGPGPLASGEVAHLGSIGFEVPDLAEPVRTSVELELEHRRGALVNRSSTELWLWPESGRKDRPHPEVRIAERWDDDLAGHLAGGGRAVVVVAADDALPGGLGVALQRREGAQWGGDWAQGMGWLRPELTAGLPLRPRIDFAFAGLTPDHLLLGYGPAERNDVLAAYYLGWIHSTAAAVAAFKHGRGSGVICTLPLLGPRLSGDPAEPAARATDPLATRLLDRLVDLVAAPSFCPGKEI